MVIRLDMVERLSMSQHCCHQVYVVVFKDLFNISMYCRGIV